MFWSMQQDLSIKVLSLQAHLMSQDVDIMTNVARRSRMLLLSILALLWLLHLDLALHVSLFDHLHLKKRADRHKFIHLTPCEDAKDIRRTSSLGLMLYSILSAFSLS